ncbi:hypothetical protein PIB30_102806 [Stylosanthes scabra]|uniref:Uncharacterized protein n=1 Tax=Stylosanthes scabra TaxID=79078 RepID=A0ABU6TZZ5_9FABA|nr:hypothetical protein [Stylosanthes scabra]
MELSEDMNPVHHNNEQDQQQKQKDSKLAISVLEGFKFHPQDHQNLNQLVGCVNDKQIPSPLELLSNYASSFIRLSGRNLLREQNKDVELAQFLFAAVERIVCRQFEQANSLLLHCCQWNNNNNSPSYGNSVQRTIFHFSQALSERIKKEIGSGMVTIRRLQNRNPIEELQRDHNAAVTCHQKLPFNQVMQFVGVQTVIEYVSSQNKIHMIDLALGYGLMAATIMEALAEREESPVELLKITAVVYGDSRGVIDDTGSRLVSLGESLNLSFLFKIVFVRDINELDKDDFEIEKDEAVVVYSPNFLWTLVSFPDSLDKLMRVIKKIKPGLMTVHC